ncbi:hypothetical protein PG985_016063 [Apiospora marii]|uniref:uncharacterized protein n=1 Tax=Apiospora marii TaxID=335849 RepID=UPI00312E3B07
MDANLCSCSVAPPPYQLHTSPLPPDEPPTNRPQSSSFVADGLRYSALQINSRFSDASLPIYETYCDPPPSPPSGNGLAPEQLRNGLKALFQGFTPLAPRTRPASRATTVSAVSLPNRDSVMGPGQEEKRRSAASELPDRADTDSGGQLRSHSSPYIAGATMRIRDRAISELYDHKQDTQVGFQIASHQKSLIVLFMTDLNHDEVYLKTDVQRLAGGA